MAIFNSYYVFPVRDKLTKLKDDFIRDEDSYNLCSISSKNSDWFKNKNGIYVVKSEDNFKIESINTDIMSLRFINEFIRKGLNSKYQLNEVKQDDLLYFILSWLGINKDVNGFRMAKAALLTEDIFNIYMIMARKFLSTTTPEDLSKYRDFFTVFEVPGQFINTDKIEQEYKSGAITLDEMNERISLIDREHNAILSLRR